jgi:cation transport ATPase
LSGAINGEAAAVLRFHDSPRADGRPFIDHLRPVHGVSRVLLVLGDRESEVRWLAELVGIEEVHAEVSPEGKLAIVEAAGALVQEVIDVAAVVNALRVSWRPGALSDY